MPNMFDKDSVIGDEVETLDQYTAAMNASPSAKTGASKKGTGTAIHDDDAEEESFGPSVEEEAAKDGVNLVGDPATAPKKKPVDTEDDSLDERKRLEDLENEMLADRDREMFTDEEEG